MDSHGFCQATSGSRGDVKIRHRRRAGRARRVSSRPGNLGEVRVKGEFSWRKCGKISKTGEKLWKIWKKLRKIWKIIAKRLENNDTNHFRLFKWRIES